MPGYGVPQHAEGMNTPSSRPGPDPIGWGTPPTDPSLDLPGEPPPAPTTPLHGGGRWWTAIRAALLGILTVLGGLAVVGGLVMVVSDLVDTTDEWHGLGIAIGLILAVPGLVVGLLAGLGLHALRRRGTRGGRVHTVVLGVLLLALLLGAPGLPALASVSIVGGLLLAVVALETRWDVQDRR